MCWGDIFLTNEVIPEELPVDVVQLLIDRWGRRERAGTGTRTLAMRDSTVLISRSTMGNSDCEVAGEVGRQDERAYARSFNVEERKYPSTRGAGQHSPAAARGHEFRFQLRLHFVPHNSLTAMTMGLSRKRGFRIDEKSDAAQVRANVDILEKLRDRMHQGSVSRLKTTSPRASWHTS